MNSIQQVYRFIVLVTGMLVGFLEPTFNFLLVATLFCLFDCYTAWKLSRRAYKKYKNSKKVKHKFTSSAAYKVITKLLEVYSLILLAYIADMMIYAENYLYLANVVSGAFCFIEAWSILENLSSCSDNRLAKLLQKIMVDKTERHLNIDLSEFKDEKEEEKE